MYFFFSLIFLNIQEIIFYAILIGFIFSFLLGTYFSRNIKNNKIYIIIGIIYYIIGLILSRNFFNPQLTFSAFFLLKYLNKSYSTIFNLLYFILIFLIVIMNPLFLFPIRNLIYQNIQNVFSSNLQSILTGSEYQLDNIYMGGYIEAENILYQYKDLQGVNILLVNQNNVNSTFINESKELIQSYLNYYNSTISNYSINIIDSMYPELSFILSIVFLELFIIFININKKIEDL